MKWVSTKKEVCAAIDEIWAKIPALIDPLQAQAIAEKIGEIKNLIEHLPAQDEKGVIR